METSVIIAVVGIISAVAGCIANRKNIHALPGTVIAIAMICVYANFLPAILATFEAQATLVLIASICGVLALAVFVYFGGSALLKSFLQKGTETKSAASKVPGAKVVESKKPKVTGVTKLPPVDEELAEINKRILAKTLPQRRKPGTAPKQNKKVQHKQSTEGALARQPVAEVEEVPREGKVTSKEEILLRNRRDVPKRDEKAVKPIHKDTRLSKEKQFKPERAPVVKKQKASDVPDLGHDDDILVAAVLPDSSYKTKFIRPGTISASVKKQGKPKYTKNPNFEEVPSDYKSRLKTATQSASEIKEIKLSIPEEELVQYESQTQQPEFLETDIKTAFAYKSKGEFALARKAFESCLILSADLNEKKLIELEILDILIRMENTKEATAKVFSILRSGFDLNSVERARLIRIMRILENQA